MESTLIILLLATVVPVLIAAWLQADAADREYERRLILAAQALRANGEDRP